LEKIRKLFWKGNEICKKFRKKFSEKISFGAPDIFGKYFYGPCLRKIFSLRQDQLFQYSVGKQISPLDSIEYVSFTFQPEVTNMRKPDIFFERKIQENKD